MSSISNPDFHNHQLSISRHLNKVLTAVHGLQTNPSTAPKPQTAKLVIYKFHIYCVWVNINIITAMSTPASAAGIKSPVNSSQHNLVDVNSRKKYSKGARKHTHAHRRAHTQVLTNRAGTQTARKMSLTHVTCTQRSSSCSLWGRTGPYPSYPLCTCFFCRFSPSFTADR